MKFINIDITQINTSDMFGEIDSGFIAHGCNCQGAMGSGIARVISNKWPEVYNDYRNEFIEGYFDERESLQRKGQLRLGTIVPVKVEQGKIVIVNAMTQRFYRGHPDRPNAERHTNYEAVARAMEKINRLPEQFPGVEPILHFPLIGADLGGGNWEIIATIIDKTVTSMPKVLWKLY